MQSRGKEFEVHFNVTIKNLVAVLRAQKKSAGVVRHLFLIPLSHPKPFYSVWNIGDEKQIIATLLMQPLILGRDIEEI